VFAFRAELEFRAGGNVSWNTGIDYGIQLLLSPNFNEVWALYQQAGLSLFEDIETLNRAARIKANPASVQYLEQNIIFDGVINIPVLTMHTTGDGLVINENETAYRTIVDLAGNGNFLRQTFVSRAGHCSFTPAETIAAVGTLLTRVETGHWPTVEPNVLNGEATALGPTSTFLKRTVRSFRRRRLLLISVRDLIRVHLILWLRYARKDRIAVARLRFSCSTSLGNVLRSNRGIERDAC
jgi:hypothetical protein